MFCDPCLGIQALVVLKSPRQNFFAKISAYRNNYPNSSFLQVTFNMQSIRIWLQLPMDIAYARQALIGVGRYCAESPGWQAYQGTWLAEFSEQPDLLRRITSEFDAVLSFCPADAMIEAAKFCQRPLVNISNRTDMPEVVSVIADNENVGRMAAEHLLDARLEDFTFHEPVSSLAFSLAREKGFRERILAAGKRYHPWPESLDLAAALQRLPKPIGIGCYSDRVAIEVLQTCQRLRLHVPNDIAIVGVDNDTYTVELARPRLTSIDIGADHIGYEAMRILGCLLQGQNVPKRTVVGGAFLIPRDSSNALLVNDPDVRRAMEFIRTHEPRAELSVESVAHHVALSRRSLERRFRDVLNTTPGEEIRRMQINAAKYLLAGTALSLAEVAARAGFGTQKHLSAVFRDHLGMSAREFRQQQNRAHQMT